jgi:hypothetical protein
VKVVRVSGSPKLAAYQLLHVHIAICPHVITPAQINAFSGNLIKGSFTKSFSRVPVLKSGQQYRAPCEDLCGLFIEMFIIKVTEETESHFAPNTFSEIILKKEQGCRIFYVMGTIPNSLRTAAIKNTKSS